MYKQEKTKTRASSLTFQGLHMTSVLIEDYEPVHKTIGE